MNLLLLLFYGIYKNMLLNFDFYNMVKLYTIVYYNNEILII